MAMAASPVIHRVVVSASRASLGFYRQNQRSHRFATLHHAFKRGILSIGGERKPRPSFVAHARPYSTRGKEQSVDSGLIRIIQSEIKVAEEESREAESIPKSFPFEIQDVEGTNVVTLRRKYLNESIEVVVSMPGIEEPEINEEEDDAEENQVGDDNANQPTIPLIVNISKGKSLNLEFCCSAYADEVVIDGLSIKGNKESDDDDMLAYEGPDFNNLDENLQKAFHKFLEIRGISPAITNFLYEYMVSKDDREYLIWLQNLKQFVEK
ncbi:hypothetical protein HPP92_001513 [Vanilla planifolia]|uniref:Mitochondrial glycoprotein n=1 Tax=Vanilla planifolia TaxID=51239 RepID=A0A835S009_VANPL|nr:hypothetical protein HPP92_001513 [Vanilla planifolia]